MLRITKNTVVGERLALEWACRPGPTPRGRREAFTLQLFFSHKRMKKSGRDTHLMLLSNVFEGREALDLYRERWGIERLFGHLKKNGFDLEATHITAADKLEKLFAIVSLSFLFSFAWGCHLKSQGKASTRQAQRKSLFRLGLNSILSLLERHSERGERGEMSEDWREFLDWIPLNKFTSISLA